MSVSGRGRCSSRARRSGSAGTGKPALRRVAALGDGWIPQATPLKQLPDDIAYILRHRDEVRPGAVPEIGLSPRRVRRRTGLRHRSVLRVHGSPEQIVESFNRLGAIGHQPSAGAVRAPVRVGALRPDRGVRRRSRPAPHPARRSPRHEGVPMPLLTMRQDFRAPAFGTASASEIYRAALDQMKWADKRGFDFARAVGAPRHRRRMDAGAAHDRRGILAMTERAPILLIGLDPPVARPDPHRRADRGDRQRVPGPVVDRVRCGLPRRGVRDGRTRARGARQDPRGTRRRDAAGVDGRAVRVARARPCASRPKPVTEPHRDGVRRRRSAGRRPPRRAPAAPDVADEHRSRACTTAYSTRQPKHRLHRRVRAASRRARPSCT